MATINYNKRFEPQYDNDLIPKWFFENKMKTEIFIPGEVKTYMGTNVPDGWLLCDGSELSRNHYKNLFNNIGTNYGSGDGVSTFELPTIIDNDCVLGYKIIKI